MSSREKKLLILFLTAGFLLVNFFLYSLFVQKRTIAANELNAAKARLQQAIAFQNSSDQLAEQIDWLTENEPEPSVYQTVQTNLQQFSERQAVDFGLTIKKQELLPTDTTGIHYHRAQIRIRLTGPEQALYRWFDSVNNPSEFRSAYQIRLNPNTQDDTLIDCTATLAQWFPPTT
ncbi:MAG: hypothetical protein AB8D78_10200 [Akkermansiaceae bacterium]